MKTTSLLSGQLSILHGIVPLDELVFKPLGLDVVAEGVESEEIYNVLKDLNCDAAQGFYISRPVEVKPLIALLSSA